MTISYEIQAGRRILLSKREGDIRIWEEIAHSRADATGRTFFVVESNLGKIFMTEDPSGSTIMRVCRPIR
jgi:hypothetical protein